MGEYCSMVMCEAKVKRETPNGDELMFVNYQTDACVSAENEKEAWWALNKNAGNEACRAVKDVDGLKATCQRALFFISKVYKK